MSNITSTQTNTSDSSSEAIAKAAQAKAAQANAIKAKVNAELASQDAAWDAFQKTCQLGQLGLEARAIQCGESVTATGRPTIKAFAKLAAALIAWRNEKGEKMDFRKRDFLYSLAQKAVGSRKGEEGYYTPKNDEELAKARQRFVSAKGKATDDRATCALRMARPAAEEIALGE